jgi:hypothetical protein
MKRRVKIRKDYQGIAICERWLQSYAAFREDMGECPSKLHTLDRIENHKGYEPGNCRWATGKEQQNNKNNNRRMTLKDGSSVTVAQWCEMNQIPPNARNPVYVRIRKGFTPEEAVEGIKREGV